MGYLLLRSIAGEGARRARLSAVYGIVGWIDVPIVFLSIWLWRTIHPRLLGSGGFAMDSRMVVALMVSLAAFTLLYVCLLVLRARTLTMEAEVTGLRARLRRLDRRGGGLMSNLGFLALGYGLIWVIIGAYVWFVGRRQTALRRQLDELQVEVNEAAEKRVRER